MVSDVNIGFAGYLLASLAFLVLTVLLLFSWRGRALGGYVILASVATLAWAATAVTFTIDPSLDFRVLQLVELLRSGCWCLFLGKAIQYDQPSQNNYSSIRKYWWYGLLFLAAVLSNGLYPLRGEIAGPHTGWLLNITLVLWVVVCILGLLLVEQIFRYTVPSGRWAIKFLCLGVGTIFAYDFYMYSHALLFKHIDMDLWSARGFVMSLVAPLIAISVARNPGYAINIHVSRDVVFHSVTIMATAVYLLVMAFVGYIIRVYGGVWGQALEVSFLFGAGLLLLSILFSDKIRAKLRVLLSKHFFSFKYDYRQQWLNFTNSLAVSEEELPEKIIMALGNLIESPGGYLWTRDGDKFCLLRRWNAPEIADTADNIDSLEEFLQKTQWIVDIEEYQENPGRYAGLTLPKWSQSIIGAWLIVPLVFNNRIQGFVVLKRSNTLKTLDWEDRDLLKVSGRQAASYLAQYQADQALLKARQFEAFNRLSAYVVHDLKNILAQQSLIVSNAGKHKDKPEFIDDVILTIKNSVSRMTRLMDQMKSGMRGNHPQDINLSALLSQVMSKFSESSPRPRFEAENENLHIIADADQFANVFSHLVQNAVEATDNDGEVVVRLKWTNGQACVEVEDTGVGMDREFIENRLFEPFDSTKGLTGMGIGVFESREYIRSLGGEVRVNSSPGFGTRFSIDLPIDVQSIGELTEAG